MKICARHIIYGCYNDRTDKYIYNTNYINKSI